jgi:hypothetical protein
LVDDEKLSPCLPFYYLNICAYHKKMGEHRLLSHCSCGSRLLAFSRRLLNPESPSNLRVFACRVNKAWLIMAGLVIFQSHSFSLFNTVITVGHLFNIASLFNPLFELGNRHTYRLTRPRKTGNLGNLFASNNLSISPIQYIRLT